MTAEELLLQRATTALYRGLGVVSGSLPLVATPQPTVVAVPQPIVVVVPQPTVVAGVFVTAPSSTPSVATLPQVGRCSEARGARDVRRQL